MNYSREYQACITLLKYSLVVLYALTSSLGELELEHTLTHTKALLFIKIILVKNTVCDIPAVNGCSEDGFLYTIQ